MKLGGRLDRYIVGEVLGPAALGFVTYTFLLMMRAVFSLVEQIFARGVSVSDALHLLALAVPHVVVLTIPMSYLFGVLLAVGRMNSDNELIALQAGGLSARRLLVPVMALGLVLAAGNAYLTLVIMPASNRALRELRLEMFVSSRSLGRIEPRVFNESFPNLLVYIQNINQESGAWQDVLIYDRSHPDEERLTVARSGRLVTEVPTADGAQPAASGAEPGGGNGDQLWLVLEDVVSHQFVPAKPKTYRVNSNTTQLVKLSLSPRATTRYTPSAREHSTQELLSALHDPARKLAGPSKEKVEEYRAYGVELNRRLAIPAASVVFALLALPLGVGSRSGGKARGFVVSIGVILAYYVMFNHGELLALEGKVPVWVGVWLPDILLAALAVVLYARMGRWLGERQEGASVMGRLLRLWNQWRRGLATRGGLAGPALPSTGSIPIKLQRRQYVVRFPTLLDRYIVKRLAAPLVFVLVSTTALFTVVDLTDHIDEVGKNNVELEVVVAYLWHRVPQVILEVTPFALLIGVLLLLALLERHRELTTLKASGLSLLRVMVPVLAVALAASGCLWSLEESVVPRANREAKRLEDVIRGRATARSYQATDRQWLISRDGSSLYNFLRYDVATQTMVRFTQFRFDDAMRLRFYLSADSVRWKNGSWIADRGWFRRILSDGSDEYGEVATPIEVGIQESPSYFGQEYRRPAEMSYRELVTYIQALEASGYRPGRLMVLRYKKLADPLAALVMVFLALPFGLNRAGGRKVGTMQGITIAITLGIGYLLLVKAFSMLGEIDLLPPILGAWAPVGLAALFALNRMTTLRT